MSDSTPDDPTSPPALERSRQVARVLDDLIPVPGTRLRFGLDPILGLIPGGGDLISWLVSLHLLWTGWTLKADPATLLRMVGHLLLDALLGAFPVVGDLFDFAYKANDRNLVILEKLHADPVGARRSSIFWLIGLASGSTAVVVGLVWVMVRLLSSIFGLLPGL